MSAQVSIEWLLVDHLAQATLGVPFAAIILDCSVQMVAALTSRDLSIYSLYLYHSVPSLNVVRTQTVFAREFLSHIQFVCIPNDSFDFKCFIHPPQLLVESFVAQLLGQDCLEQFIAHCKGLIINIPLKRGIG